MIYTPLTKKALKISFNAHKDQVDKSGMPYVYHPFHLAEQMNDENSTCVALLHDVVEDTYVSLDDLASEGFPMEVIEALTLMTHDDNVSYMDYVRKIKTNPIATKVKLADLEHNSDLTRLDLVDDAALERADKYRRAIILLRYGEAPKSPTKIIRAWHTPCCNIDVPIEYVRCSMCGKEIVNAEETEMEIATDETISFCMECGKNMRFSDHYCGFCGARSSWWKEK